MCATAQNIGMLLAGRVIQGLGAGGQLGLVNVTISDLIAARYGFQLLNAFGKSKQFLLTKYLLGSEACTLVILASPGPSRPRLDRY